MKFQAFSAFLCLLIAANEAVKMERCQVAKILKDNGMDKIPGYKLGDWICMAYHESRFDTKAVGRPNKDGSIDYGMFQINSKYWCSDGVRPSANKCKKSCRSFTNDDIRDDIECCKIIVRDPKKMDAWVGWVKNCKGKDLKKWTQGCKL